MSDSRDPAWKLLTAISLVMSVTALAAIAVLWHRMPGPQPGTRLAEPRAGTAAPSFAGRTATLSRLLSERRAVARAELVFAARGALEVTCRAEAADGSFVACFEAEKGAGRWSIQGTSLCVTSAVIGLPSAQCYEVAGEMPRLSLIGPGFLAGDLFLR